MLSKEDFLAAINNTPLVSIDLVIRSPENAILMGKRVNEPAADHWFVPGGRIFKLETLDDAFRRITRTELGKTHDIEDSELLGAFTHIYDSNFAGQPGISTHYVVLAYQLKLEVTLPDLPQRQHSSYRWFSEHGDLADVHPNSLAYFPYLK